MFRFLGLILLILQFQFLSAQESPTGENSDTAIMYVDKSLQIYSTDENFNKHTQFREIITSEIVCEKSSNTAQNSANVKIRKTDSLQLNFSEELHLAEEKNTQIVLEEIKKKKENLRVEQKNLVKKEYYPPVSSNEFFGSKKVSKDYVSPRPFNQEVCKDVCFCEPILIKKALSHLHTQKFVYYNNKSFDDCFSNVFSVRPPPAIA